MGLMGLLPACRISSSPGIRLERPHVYPSYTTVGLWVSYVVIYSSFPRSVGSIYGGDDELIVNGYMDARFQTEKYDFRSQTRFIFYLNGGAVS